MIFDDDLELRLPDGVVLGSTVWRPRAGGRYPVILIRTPYNRQHGQDHVFAHPSWYASFGFAVVAQDIRGRWRSGGEFEPFFHDAEDGLLSIEWASELPFANGIVGTTGMSYPGLVQLHAAAQSPAPLRALVPMMSTANPYEGWIYTNGAFTLAFNVAWGTFLGSENARRKGEGASELRLLTAIASYATSYNHLPLRTFPGLEDHAPFFYEWLRHPHYDEYWRVRDFSDRLGATQASVLSIGGWYDVFLEGTIDAYSRFRARPAGSEASLVLTPWWHAPHGRFVGEFDFGEEAGAEWLDTRILRFFMQHLRDDDPVDGPVVRAFVTGANRWEHFGAWPPGEQLATYYLHATQRANSLNGDGRLTPEPPGQEAPDVFTYDPAMPTPSLGGRSGGAAPITPVGPADQRSVEMSNALLVYTADELEDDLLVAGTARFTLYATTSARDTDWAVKLCDVHPSGASINIQETIRRASHTGGERPQLLPPNEVAEFQIDIGSLCHCFRKGHRIRVEISSSNFPSWDRNMNTGNELGADSLSDRVVATQTVFHESTYPSRLVLPVLA